MMCYVPHSTPVRDHVKKMLRTVGTFMSTEMGGESTLDNLISITLIHYFTYNISKAIT